jgi:hypothetical protein
VIDDRSVGWGGVEGDKDLGVHEGIILRGRVGVFSSGRFAADLEVAGGTTTAINHWEGD